jgi:hypothetical protein
MPTVVPPAAEADAAGADVPTAGCDAAGADVPAAGWDAAGADVATAGADVRAAPDVAGAAPPPPHAATRPAIDRSATEEMERRMRFLLARFGRR